MTGDPTPPGRAPTPVPDDASLPAPPDVEVTRVLVVDDHRTFSDLLALALSGLDDLECVGTAHDARQALAMAERTRPDVVVMDVQLGEDDGVAVTAQLTATYPDMRVVVLTAHASRDLMKRAAAAGACCLLPKNGSLPDMLHALRSARQGGFVVDAGLLHLLVTGPREENPLPALSRREAEVIALLAQGKDTATIARTLGISVNTCRGYVKTLLGKLDAHSQLEAVAIAIRRGLVDV